MPYFAMKLQREFGLRLLKLSTLTGLGHSGGTTDVEVALPALHITLSSPRAKGMESGSLSTIYIHTTGRLLLSNLNP